PTIPKESQATPGGKTMPHALDCLRFVYQTLGKSLLLAMVVTLSIGVVYGQVDRAGLNGTVTDATGALVTNAHVEVVSRDTDFTRAAETGPAGVYSITELPIGTYDLRISKAGFRTLDVKGI